MSRKVDRMLAHDFVPPAWTDPALRATFPAQRQRVLTALESAEHFVVDNVCKYFYEDTDQEFWDLRKDFPNIAPPFPSFFMEMRRPHHVTSRIHGQVRVLSPGMDCEGWGILFKSHDLTQTPINWNSPARFAHLREEAGRATQLFGEQLEAKWEQFGPQMVSHLTESEQIALAYIEADARLARGEDITPNLKGARWVMTASLFVETRRSQIVGPMVIWELTIDAQGTLHAGPMVYATANPTSCDRRDAVSELIDGVGTLLYPAFLAISFLHCKNVEVARQVPPAKMSRAHERRHHRPLVRFHTLEITPMQKMLEREGGSLTNGLKKALHICRGHFKTFTPEHKLFGRHTGTYWWAAHVRGTIEQGIALKDYAVNQPAASATNPSVSVQPKAPSGSNRTDV